MGGVPGDKNAADPEFLDAAAVHMEIRRPAQIREANALRQTPVDDPLAFFQ